MNVRRGPNNDDIMEELSIHRAHLRHIESLLQLVLRSKNKEPVNTELDPEIVTWEI